MKRLKLVFHIVYVLIALVVLYFSIDILLNTEQYLSKVKLSSYIKFPKYIMSLFLTMSVLMLIEFVLERYQAFQSKDGVQSLEEQIVTLKAKLYDKKEEEEPAEEEEEEESKD